MKPNARVAQRIEELLREQLEELGVNIKRLTLDEISANMKCHIGPDNSLSYFGKTEPYLTLFGNDRKRHELAHVHKRRYHMKIIIK